MKPRLKPRKWWKFRIILIDNSGKIVYDDFSDPGIVEHLAKCMMDELLYGGKDEERGGD